MALLISLIPVSGIITRDALLTIEVRVIGRTLARFGSSIVYLPTRTNFASRAIRVEDSVVGTSKARNASGNRELGRADETIASPNVIIGSCRAVVTGLCGVVEVAEGRTSIAAPVVKHRGLRWTFAFI